MIVNRFEIFGLDAKRGHGRQARQFDRQIARDILDELGIVVGALGDIFFVPGASTPDTIPPKPRSRPARTNPRSKTGAAGTAVIITRDL